MPFSARSFESGIEVLRDPAQAAALLQPERLRVLENLLEPGYRFPAAYLLSAAARTIRGLALLLARADRAGKRLATLTLETEVRFADAPARSAFAGGSRPFRLFLGAYPAITKSKPKGPGE